MRVTRRLGLAGVCAALGGALVLGVAGAGGSGTRVDEPGGAAGAPVAVPAVPSRAPLLPAPADAPVPTAAGLRTALAPSLADPALGGAVHASVVDATTGAPLFDLGAGVAVLPASTTKIATAVAVLTGLPPQTRLSTRVVAGPASGDVVLVGGGDVALAGPQAPPSSPVPARLAELAGQVRAARGSAPVARVLVDDTRYTGPALEPSWRPGYVTGGAVAPVSALALDGGRVSPLAQDRVADPALAAGRSLAQLLGAPAAPVLRGTAPAPPTPAPGSKPGQVAPGSLPAQVAPGTSPGQVAPGALLGQVDSPAVTELVEAMLSRSDNDLAEALARRLAVEQGRPASFAGAAQAVRAVLEGVLPSGGVALTDSSGLSRGNRVAPAAVTALLVRAVQDEDGQLAPVLSGLAVAGFDGTLERRFRAGPAEPAAGQVRAKTGTLEGVSALAGLARTREGRLLAFDVALPAVPAGATRPAEEALDRLVAQLASCGCR